jgi:hypothetical protein
VLIYIHVSIVDINKGDETLRMLVRILIPTVIAAIALGSGGMARAVTYAISYSGSGSFAQAGNSASASASGQNATCSISGTITATFTWVPANSTDTAPLSAIVTEQSRTYGGGYGRNAPLSVTVSDGFGDPATGSPQLNTYYATSAGQRWSIHGGATFSITCSPSGSTSGAYASLTLSAAYSATVQPVVAALNGVTVASDFTNNILIGQGCQASLNGITGVTLQNYQWTVSGDTFKDYIAHGATTGGFSRCDFMTAVDWQQPSPLWYWRSIGVMVTAARNKLHALRTCM